MTDAVRIFVGVDPGAKGAAAVLACIDCPGDDARHGQVVGSDVFDLPTVDRAGLDGGGLDLDVAAFVSRLTTAISVARDHRDALEKLALVEFPDVGGKMRGGRRQVLVQGLNAGMVFAAVRSGLSITTGWVASRSWRNELGGVSEGNEDVVVCSALWRSEAGVALIESLAENRRKNAMDYPDALAVLGQKSAGSLVSPVSRTHGVVRPDRCVAVLLAEVARRRWLGTAVVPKTKGTAAAAKTRKANRRREAVARAVAPLTVAKARESALMDHWCDVHRMVEGPCSSHNKCCEARLLDWAWRQRPEPTEASLELGAAAVELLPRIAAIYMKAVTSKRWSVAWTDSEEVGTMEPEAFAALEKYGLMRLASGTRDVRYVPTERGVAWAKRLRASTEGLPP